MCNSLVNLYFIFTISSLILISVETSCTMTVPHHIILVLLFCVTNTWAHSLVDFRSNHMNEGDNGVKLLDNNDVYLSLFKNNVSNFEKVRIQVYYETLCEACKDFNINDLAPIVDTTSMHLDIRTYPFGNAKMISHNGKLRIRCQHGQPECYGNKLHACALDKLEHTTALLYNACLMMGGGSGSDDESADTCGKSMDVDSKPIKECAKGARGQELLLYYGKESEKAQFTYVPYILINDKVFDGDDFKNAVCDAFVTEPPSCE